MRRRDIVGARVDGVFQTPWEHCWEEWLPVPLLTSCRVFVSLSNGRFFELAWITSDDVIIEDADVDRQELILAEFVKGEYCNGEHQWKNRSVVDVFMPNDEWYSAGLLLDNGFVIGLGGVFNVLGPWLVKLSDVPMEQLDCWDKEGV